VFTTVGGRGPRSGSAAELNQIEVVAMALVELVRIEPNLGDVTFGIGSFEHTLDVTIYSGKHRLRVSAPCIPPPGDDDDLSLVEPGGAFVGWRPRH
jgi:hypothetical protein